MSLKKSWPDLFLDQYRFTVQSPATDQEIVDAFLKLNVLVHADLKEFYRISNGIHEDAGEWFVIWPLKRLIENNQDAWKHGSHVGYTGFGDDGTGDAYVVPSDGSAGVYHWEEIGQELFQLSGTLEEFLVELAAGNL